jgi:hypothetical protein
MSLVTPFWFYQRQCKAEVAGDDLYRLTGPNLKEAYIGLRRGENGRWSAYLKYAPGGPDAAVTPAQWNNVYEAWEAAFELYRVNVIV